MVLINRRSAANSFAALLVVGALSGCGAADWWDQNYQVRPVVQGGADVTKKGGAQYEAGKTIRPTIIPFDVTDGTLDGNCSFKTLYPVTDNSVACRNRLMDHLVGLSAQVCAQHKDEIMATAAGIDLGFSGVATTLGAVGAIVTGADAARALAGTAGLVSGLHSNVRDNIYQQQLSSAILFQIDQQRQAKLDQMKVLRDKSMADYTGEGLLADIVEYHDLCSFYAGVEGLTHANRRPSTVEELQGKLQMLRNQLTLANGDQVAIDRLNKAIQFTTGQLTVVTTGSGVSAQTGP